MILYVEVIKCYYVFKAHHLPLVKLFFISILAPNGCLQYYTTASDTVMSFNYGTTENTRGIALFRHNSNEQSLSKELFQLLKLERDKW